MAKSYLNITATDFEVLALAREVPFVDVELVHKVFYSSHQLPDYARKKMTLLERDGLLRGWMIPGQLKLYTLTKVGGQYLKMVSGDIDGKYFKPDLSKDMIYSSRINPPAINHTRNLIDLFLKVRSYNFFDSVFIFDHLKGKDTYTKNRPDLYLAKGGHAIYLEYENSSKTPQSYFERFKNFFRDTPKLVLVLYVCSEEWIADRITRYIAEFRVGEKAFKFTETEIKESERIYISGPNMEFKNCLGKELTLSKVIEKLST